MYRYMDPQMHTYTYTQWFAQSCSRQFFFFQLFFFPALFFNFQHNCAENFIVLTKVHCMYTNTHTHTHKHTHNHIHTHIHTQTTVYLIVFQTVWLKFFIVPTKSCEWSQIQVEILRNQITTKCTTLNDSELTFQNI